MVRFCADDNQTFATIFEGLVIASNCNEQTRFTEPIHLRSDQNVKCFVQKSDTTSPEHRVVTTTLPVGDCTDTFGRYIIFEIDDGLKGESSNSSTAGCSNAFDILMTARREQAVKLVYPQIIGAESTASPRGDWRLHSDLIHILKTRQCGVHENQIEDGKLVVSRVSFALFYIMPHLKPPPYGRTSRAWDSLLVMKSGCAGGRGFAPRPGQ